MNERVFCFEYRIGIEGEAAAAAARCRTAADMARIEAAMLELESLHHASNFSFEADFEFHLSITRATHNSFFLSSLESLRSTIYSGMLLAIAPSSLALTVKSNAIRVQHRAIAQAILRQDERAAREAMRVHLSRCRHSTRHWDDAEFSLGFDKHGTEERR